MFPNLELSIGCLPHRMVCRRKEFKGPVQWAQGIGRKEVNRTCMCTCVLSIWQFLGLGNQPARWGNTRSFHSWKLKDEVNLIFSTNFVIMAEYVEIAMSPGLGFHTDASSPSPSLKQFLCHSCTCAWKKPMECPSPFKDFLSRCWGCKKQKHTCRITMLVLTTLDLGYM